MNIKFLTRFRLTPGAISVCEGLAINLLAAQAPAGTALELGAHAGKSAIAAASALGAIKRNIVLVDPMYAVVDPDKWRIAAPAGHKVDPWPYARRKNFTLEVKRFVTEEGGPLVSVWCHRVSSLAAIPLQPDRSVAYVMIDSDDHSYELVSAEIEALRPKLVAGAVVVMHDYGNEFDGPIGVAQELTDFKPIKIPWPDIRQAVKFLELEAGNNSWHAPLNPLPCYVGGFTFKG